MEKINLDYLLGKNTDLLFNGKGKVLCSKQAVVNYFEDRLKTLEDKVKRVEQLLVKSKLIRSQDLWDEENEPKISDIGEIEKHSTCKHTPIYSGECCEECKPTVKECEHAYTETLEGCIYCGKSRITTTEPTDNSEKIEHDPKVETYNCPACIKDQKIEEIISELNKRFWNRDSKIYYEATYKEILVDTTFLESWLRDKLKKF